MRFVLIFLTVTILSMHGVCAQASSEMTAKLSEEHAKQLHQAVCNEPPHRTNRYRPDTWVCDHPRAYPKENDPAICPVNTLSFLSRGGLFEIFFGRFTADRPQAIAMYWAACEPHSSNFGGMALFNVVDQKFELVRYYRGLPFAHCVVPSLQGSGRQIPYCVGSSVAQGILSEGFGPIRFEPNGEAVFDPWFKAGNSDFHRGPVTRCDSAEPKSHHISALRLDETKSEIVLDVAVLDPLSVASACKRLREGDFNAKERELRESHSVAEDMAFIRPDELKFLTMVVRFRPPSATAEVELTSKPAKP